MIDAVADSWVWNHLSIITLPFLNDEFLTLTSQSLSCLRSDFSMKLTDWPEQSYSNVAKVDLAKNCFVLELSVFKTKQLRIFLDTKPLL